MGIKKILSFSLVAISLTLASCKEGLNEVEDSTACVALNSLSVDADVAEVKSASPAVEQFKIRLENTRGEVLRTWASIADMPATINVVPGSYKFVAWSGDTANLPSFNHIVYQGEVKFAVAAGEKVDTTVVAKLAVVKVKVNFDDSFNDQYTDYSVDVRTTTPEKPDTRSINYTTLDTEPANFEPGTLRMMLKLKTADGKEYVFYPTPIPSLKAAQLRTVNLAVKKVNGKATLKVTTDGGYDKEETIELLLPPSILPKPRPVVRAVGFDLSSNILSNESIKASERHSTVIIAQAGIKNLFVRTTNPTIIEMWGGNSEINIVGATIEQSNWLKQVGFTWGDEISTPELAERCFGRTEIIIDGLYTNLNAEPNRASTIYPFEIEIVDIFGQSNKDASGTGGFIFNFEQRPPIFALQRDLVIGDVWANKAALPISYTTNIEGREPYVEVKIEGGNWAVAQQSFIAQSQGVGLQTIVGLTPNTQYSFRVRMGDHTLPEFTATTEVAQQIENGNMERWNAVQLGTKYHDVPYYWPYADGDTPYWTTNNDRTTSYRTYGIFGTTYGYNCAPAVSYSLNAHSGQFSAEIRTTSASDIDGLNTTSVTQKHSQVAGRLYIGDFKYEKPNDKMTFGKPFNARPTAFKFFYTYGQYNGDSFDAQAIVYSGEQEIGSGYFASQPSASNADYLECNVPIVYSVTDKRADRFTISFRSTTKAQPEVYKNNSYMLNFIGNEDYNKNWAIWIGSVLRVDDVAVLY